ncbi:MAG: hypothetical protein ACU836_06505 [Gammaproteobacteria bacterium]
MAEFYVETNPQTNGDHVVHRIECSLLPAKDTISYLGSIASGASAIKKAAERFKQVNGCPQCVPNCHTA